MNSNETEERELDAREQLERWLAFLRRALRFWPTVLLLLVLGGLGSAVFLHFKHPRYRSETVILYVEKGGTNDDSEAANASRTMPIRMKELLLSRSTLERVVTEFDLYPDVRSAFGIMDAVEELKKHVEFRAPGGDTISIAFEGSSADEAQKVTAELAHLVIDGDAELRKGQAHVALEFLVGEKRSTETQLRDAEQKLASFMAQHPRFALDATPLASGTAIRATLGAGGAQLGGLSRLPMIGRMSSSPAGGQQGAASSNAPRPAGSREVSPDEARARAAVAAARENLNEQLSRYTPAHPDVRAAEAALAQANERLAALAQAPGAVVAAPDSAASTPAVASAPGTPPAATPAPPPPRRVVFAPAPVQPNPAQLGERTKEVVTLETDWLKLTRAVTEAHQRQDQVEAQLFRADIQASSEGAGRGVEVNVIDPAYLPQRALPPSRNAIIAMFSSGGLLLGLLLALIRAAFDDRLFAARDLVGISEVLVEIPKLARERRQRVAI